MSLGRPLENNNGFPRLYFDSFIGLRNIKTKSAVKVGIIFSSEFIIVNIYEKYIIFYNQLYTVNNNLTYVYPC